MRDVFKQIDSQTRSFYGFNPFAIMWNVSTWRKYFAVCVLVASLAWAFFGWDSTWSQAKPIIENIFPLLQEKIPLRSVLEQSKSYYGIGNHFSAPVIYGISFICLSRYLEEIGVIKSLNFCATTGMSLMSIGIFELMWNSAYAYFHGQTWVVTFQWKQAANLYAFIAFVIIGLLVLIYLRLEDYRPNFSKISISLLLLTVGCWIFWINYPLPVNHIIVETSTGPWTNSNMFPQTYYAVDVAPNDNIAIGEPNWVQDDVVHFVNTFTKVIQTCAILSICRVEVISPE